MQIQFTHTLELRVVSFLVNVSSNIKYRHRCGLLRERAGPPSCTFVLRLVSKSEPSMLKMRVSCLVSPPISLSRGRANAIRYITSGDNTHDTSTRVVSVTVWFVVSGREAPGGYPLT